MVRNFSPPFDISIHALREEGDVLLIETYWMELVFLSTPSARRATLMRELAIRIKDISIHALREEGDWSLNRLFIFEKYFYPRPPRGGRLFWHGIRYQIRQFLSTPSARRATSRQVQQAHRGYISIHALREEGDCYSLYLVFNPPTFLSTPSARRATSSKLFSKNNKTFLSTPSARRATHIVHD